MATGGEIELTERQRDVLNLIQATPMLSAKALADRLGINKSAVEKHLNALKKKGVLRRVGGTICYWEVLEESDE